MKAIAPMVCVAAVCAAAGLWTGACKKPAQAVGEDGGAGAPAAVGPLSLARLKQARLLVRVPGRLSDASAAVEGALGPAMSREPTRHSWAVTAGADCHELSIDAQPTGELRAVGIRTTRAAMGAAHARCVSVAGRAR